MVNPMGYQVYNQPSTYELHRPLEQAVVPIEVKDTAQINRQKAIPNSETRTTMRVKDTNQQGNAYVGNLIDLKL